jgi:hypothetical protein
MEKFKEIKPFFLFIVLLFFSVNVQAQVVTYSNSWGAQGMTLKSQSFSGVHINYSINTMNLEDVNVNGTMMKAPRLEGIFLPNNEGAPDLAGTGRYIAIPQGSRAILNVKSYRTETYTNIDIAPAPRIPWDNENGPPVFNKKQEVYSKNAYYPENPVIISEPTHLRGVDAVILGVTPFQYNPVTKELIVYRDIDIEINFSGGTGHFGEDRLRSRWWDPILEDALFNYLSLPKIDYNALLRPDNITTTGCEYLIIRPDGTEFASWADSIKKFRTLQGIKTDIVTITEVGGNVASTVENYVNNAYNTWTIPPVAILMLGDYGTSTSNNLISPIYNNYCVSDNILADVNNDQLPDIAFARITANNDAQLQVMITKFLNYERNPPTSADFYDHPITALGWQTVRWFQICSETIGGFWKYVQNKHPVRVNAVYQGNPLVDPWSTATNTSTVLAYFGPSGQNYIPATPQELGGFSGGTAAMINTAINSGSFILQHRDHGAVTGWGEPAYSNSNINGLTNTNLTFIMSINCLTGEYNYSSECFAEKFHRYTYNNQNSGALGLIAASQTSYSFVNDAYVWGMVDNFWPNYMPTYGAMYSERGVLPAFGNCAGKYFLQQSSWPYNTSNKEVTYHLFHHHGDAFLMVYSEVPQNLTVSHANTINATDTSFAVTANAGSFIALTFNGNILGTGTGTGAPLNIHITGGQSQPDSMDVVVTKQNYFRYHAKVRVIGTPVSVPQVSEIPSTYSLSQNYPNPFNPVTQIHFGLPKVSNVKLVVYDILGREVSVLINGRMNAGYHNFEFSASNLPSGVYFYRLITDGFIDTKKMTLIK